MITREIETQTESEPLKTFASADCQTEKVETAAVRVQTENATMKDGSMQTRATLTDTISV